MAAPAAAVTGAGTPPMAAPGGAAPGGAAGGAPVKVAAGPADSITEPVAAAGASGKVMVATDNVVPGPARVTAWHHRSGAGAWGEQGAVLPTGFAASYDPSLAALPDGRVALAAVAAAVGGPGCIPQSSVYLATTTPGSLAFGTPVVVDDHRQGGGFDDRPFVAAGPGGRLWVAWSHGQPGDQCQIVGRSDQIEITSSTNGGRSFTAPVTLPKVTSGAAFGVQVAPLGGDRAAVSWAELSGTQVTVVMTVVSASGTYSPPHQVAQDPSLPRTLDNRAGFFAFSLPSLVSFDHHRDLALAWPWWSDGSGVIEVAVSRDLGRSWTTNVVSPGPGTDLLLPALAPDGPNHLRLLFAVHAAAGRSVGYSTLVASVGSAHGAVGLGPATQVLAGPPGPGFKELGEFLFLSPSPRAVLGGAVAGGSAGATLYSLSWPLSSAGGSTAAAPTTAPSTSSQAANGAGAGSHQGGASRGSGSSGSSSGPGGGAAGAGAAAPVSSHRHPGHLVLAVEVALAVLLGLLAVAAGLRARVLARRRARRRARLRARQPALGGAGRRPPGAADRRRVASYPPRRPMANAGPPYRPMASGVRRGRKEERHG